jgi:hypothetical protein
MWNKDISKLTDAELDERSKKDLASAPAQPEPRGSEALDWDYLVAKWLVQQKGDFHWNQQRVIEFTKWALAAATSERTPPVCPSCGMNPCDEKWHKSTGEPIADRQPAPPEPE